MKPRQQRMIFVGAIAVLMVMAAAFAYRAFNENLLYSFTPTQIVNGEAPEERTFKLGGLVREGSIERDPGSLTIRFVVTDLEHDVQAEYTGVTPDLFMEGKGVVAHGVVNADGRFIASKVLARHDENYMAPEVQDALAASESRAAR
jgi:cytochrome c-type biogenesis protein CcmE